MNVFQHFEQVLGVSPTNNLMGDAIPLNSAVGVACGDVIKSAATFLQEHILKIDPADGIAQYGMRGHLYGAFGPNSQEMYDFQEGMDNGNLNNTTIIRLAQRVCECYIYG
jgi:hypothetical protein